MFCLRLFFSEQTRKTQNQKQTERPVIAMVWWLRPVAAMLQTYPTQITDYENVNKNQVNQAKMSDSYREEICERQILMTEECTLPHNAIIITKCKGVMSNDI